MNKKYYVYCLLDPFCSGRFKYGRYKLKYKPFYVGKGQGRRMFEHCQDSVLFRDKDKNKKKVNKIKKIMRLGGKPIIIKIHGSLNDDDALKKENKLIGLIGLKNLTNLTPGGEKTTRFRYFSKKTQKRLRKIFSIRMKKNNPMKNPDTAKKVSITKTGHRYSEEYKKKMSLSLRDSKIHKNRVRSKSNRDLCRRLKKKYMVPIKQYDIDLKYLKSFPSIKQAARELKIKSRDISTVVNGRQKTCHGFIFKKCICL